MKARPAALAFVLLACGAGSTGPTEAKATPGTTVAAAAPRAALVIGEKTAERVKALWDAAVGGFGRAVAVSAKVGRVAASSGSPVLVYDLSTGKEKTRIRACAEVVRGGLEFAGGKLFVACADRLEAYDPRTGKAVEVPDAHESKITAVSWAWPRVAAGHHDGVVRIYGLDGSPTIEIPVPGPPIDVKSLALTADGSKVAVAWVQGSIWWWETAKPTVFHKLVRHTNESDTVAFNSDGSRFAEEGEPGLTTVWSFGSAPSVAPASTASLSNGDWVKRLEFSADSKWLIRGGSDGLDLAEIDGPKRVVLDTRGKVEDLATDETGARIAAIDRDGRLSVWGVK